MSKDYHKPQHSKLGDHRDSRIEAAARAGGGVLDSAQGTRFSDAFDPTDAGSGDPKADSTTANGAPRRAPRQPNIFTSLGRPPVNAKYRHLERLEAVALQCLLHALRSG